MNIVSTFLVLVFSGLIAACSPITEKDLAELQSPNDAVKKEAIQKFATGERFPVSLVEPFLTRSREKKAVAIMAELLHGGGESEDIQVNILKAMGELGKRTQVPVSPLIEKLKERNPRIRLQAVESLGKIKNKEAVPALVRLLEKEGNTYPIIWALGEIGDKSALPALNRLLASGDKYARYNANKALRKIR